MKLKITEEHKYLLELVKHGKLFEIMEWVDSGKSTRITDGSRRRHSLIYHAIEQGNHSMIIYIVKNADFLPWETENLIGWAGGLPKDLRTEVINFLLDQGVPLGYASASDIFLTFDDEVIDRALTLGLTLRGCDGFADCLIETNVARPLLRYFRTYRQKYPDLEVEAIIATKWFVQKRRKKACALMGWVGVDNHRKISNSTPYEPADKYDESILDEIRLDEDTEELLKLLKIKITPEIWWHFFKLTMWLEPEHLGEVCSWIKHPEQVIQNSWEQAEEALDSAIRFFASKDDYIYSSRADHELGLIKAAQHLVLLGVKCLTNDSKCYRDYRSPMYATKHKEEVAELCWLMYECGDNEQKQRVYELVKTPQLKRIIKCHEPQLIRDLGLATKFEMQQDHKNESAERLSKFDLNYFSNIVKNQ